MEESQGHVTTEFVLLGAWDLWIQVLVGCLAVAVIAMAIYNYRNLRPIHRRISLLGLRLGGVALLLGIFFQPAILEERQARSRNQIALVIDASESMGLPYGQGARLDAAKEFITRHRSQLESLATDNDLLFYALGTDLTPLPNLLADEDSLQSLTPTAPQTRLIEGFEQLQSELFNRDLGGVLLLSDGLDTQRERDFSDADRRIIQELNAPVFAFAPTGGSPFKDVSIKRLASNAFGFYMNQTTLEADIEVVGYSAGTLEVVCRENDTVLGKKLVAIEPGKNLYRVSFDHVPKRLGKQVMTLEVAPFDDEIYRPNNTRQTIVHIVRDKIRVLQIVGQPSWDERFLRNHLKSDPNIDLISFFILVNPQNFRPVPTRDTALIPFPAEELFERELGSFDLVIFQNFNYGPFRTRQYLPRIAEFVRNGGGFVMIGGPRSFASGGYRGTSIADVLPVDLPPGGGNLFLSDARDPNVDTTDFKVSLTQTGRQHPITRLTRKSHDNVNAWKAIEALEGFNHVLGIKPDALTLLEHPTKSTSRGDKSPLVSIREAKKGRAMAVLTDSTWHWSFHAGNNGGNRDHYDEFWANAIRWLIRDPELELVRVGLQDDQINRGENASVRIEAFQSDYAPAQNVPVSVELIQHATSSDSEDTIIQVTTTETTNAEGFLELQIPVNAPGIYTVKATVEVEKGRTQSGLNIFVGNEIKREFERLQTDVRFLEAITSESQGAVIPLNTQNLELNLKPPKVIKVTSRRSEELWTEPWIIVVATLLFGCEWFFRRKYGYV